MDFSYPDTHIDLQTLAADVLGDFTSVERLKKLETNGPYFDQELWQKLAETGILSANLSESDGGMGMDYSASVLVAEVIGKTLASVPYIPCIISSALPLSNVKGNSRLTQLLQKVASGDSLMTAAFIEPGSNEPLQPLVSVSGDGEACSISGIKHCVPYAADADALLVSARRLDSEGKQALWLGLIDVQQSGVTLDEQCCTAREPQYQVTFSKASATTIASGDRAEELLQRAIAMTTVAYCSMATGAVDRMTRIGAEYTSQREQFGVPIATFQAVAHKLANCYIDTECLRIITQKASSDVNDGDLTAGTIAMAKAWCGDALHRVSHAVQHVHGGAGIDCDYHLYRYCLWAKQLELSLGCSKQHIETLADSIEAKYLAG